MAALSVSVFEVSALRTQQRAAVWPYLAVDQCYSGDGYALFVENKGVGPARVRHAELQLDDAPIGDITAAIRAELGHENAFSFDVFRTSDPSRSVMSAGDRETLFAVPWEARTKLLTTAWADRLGAEVCYCSIYDECWVTRLSPGAPNAEPQGVSRCPGG